MPNQLFNGDFVDRGSFSVECIFVLFGFKLLYPESFFMARGKLCIFTFCILIYFTKSLNINQSIYVGLDSVAVSKFPAPGTDKFKMLCIV